LMRTLPIPAISALAEPDNPAKNILAKTVV
jgi:hypothetical protein